MNNVVVHLQPAFILQHRKYRETSLIIDVLTKEFGLVSILARSVRKRKSKLAGLLLPFTALKISYIGKNDLKILTHAELDSLNFSLKGLSLYCGFYVNELVSLLLQKFDPYPEIYALYFRCLLLLNDVSINVEETLRFFELDLIECLGYGVELSYDNHKSAVVTPHAKYLFRGELGMVEHINGYITGGTLLALEARSTLNIQALNEAKQLMRKVIDFQLEGRKLKSRLVLAKIIKQL
ncbi:MAG: DNA repair protein RecO [Methylococcales bacterium]|nr:DNA repair protein RecO [Methylococcales bacterium]